jgi:hypothetical protein
MKRYLFAALFIFACTGTFAQSLSFTDLLNMTGMSDAQLHDFLSSSRGFRAMGLQSVNGRAYQQFKLEKGTTDKMESVLVGVGVKSVSGITTHEIIYNNTQEQDLNNLLAQAKKSNLTLLFQGADLTSNIYRFDNSLFRASVSLAFDKKSGNVDVQQK